MNSISIKETFEELGLNWPSSIVARTELSKFSGGLLKRITQSSRDSRGTGCPKIKVGRNVCYRKQDLIEWLIKKAENDNF